VATLTAEQILAKKNYDVIGPIAVPEWEGEVYIRLMSVGQRDSYDRLFIGKRDTGIQNWRAHLLARTLCDESGNLLFTVDQVDALGEMNAAPCERLWSRAWSHNKMDEKAVEDAAKN